MSPRSLPLDAVRCLALLGGALAAAALALVAAAALGWPGLLGALGAYGAVSLLVLRGLPHHLPHPRFGLANAVTLLRAAVVALLAGIVMDGAPLSPAGRWALVVAGGAALLLDGVDGWAARRTGLASRFGARFDMETDAFFVLALSALVWRAGQAGGWVLASGAMRYIFVLAGWVFPVLAGPVPPRWRRKAICVVQVAALILALAPPLAPGAASLLCAGALALLVYSFAADGIWLLAAPPGRQGLGRVTT